MKYSRGDQLNIMVNFMVSEIRGRNRVCQICKEEIKVRSFYVHRRRQSNGSELRFHLDCFD